MSESVFIVLFRGVGGATKLPTEPLRAALTGAGFRNVATYIASGNAVLVSDLTADAVGHSVARVAAEKFGFAKAIMVISREDWAEIIRGNPFPEAVTEPTSLHAFALAGEPSTEAVARLAARAAATERVAVRGKALYFHAPLGFGVSKLPPIVDRTLAVATTARNWNTVMKLDDLARRAAAS